MNSPKLATISSGDKVRVIRPESQWFGGTGEVYRKDSEQIWVRLVYRGTWHSIGFAPTSLEKVR